MFYLSTMFSAIAKFAVPLLGVETGLFGYDLSYTIIPLIAGRQIYGYWVD